MRCRDSRLCRSLCSSWSFPWHSESSAGRTSEQALPTLGGYPQVCPPAFPPPPPQPGTSGESSSRRPRIPSPQKFPFPPVVWPHPGFPGNRAPDGHCHPLTPSLCCLTLSGASPGLHSPLPGQYHSPAPGTRFSSPTPCTLLPALAPASSLSRGLALRLACPCATSPTAPCRPGTPRTGPEETPSAWRQGAVSPIGLGPPGQEDAMLTCPPPCDCRRHANLAMWAPPAEPWCQGPSP